jgi:hypothetical protein
MTSMKRKRLNQHPSDQVTIDALVEHIAVIDASGRIVAVNRAWREFAATNGADPMQVSEGANYLAVCDRAAAQGCKDAATAAASIREVFAGRSETGAGVKRRRWSIRAMRRMNLAGSRRESPVPSVPTR